MNTTIAATGLYLAYIFSNIAGLFLLLAAVKWPTLGRVLLSILFAWASWVNYTLSNDNPVIYLSYAQKSVPLYADFINGWFRQHITQFVNAITAGQALIAIGLGLNGLVFKLACFGIILFLLAIAPLGIYAAFPFSLTVSGAAFILMRKEGIRVLNTGEPTVKTTAIKDGH